MVYYAMRDNIKVFYRSTVSPLDPSDYYVNEAKVRLKESDNKVEGSIGDLKKFHK